MELENTSCGYIIDEKGDDYDKIYSDGRKKYLYKKKSLTEISIINQFIYPNILNIGKKSSVFNCNLEEGFGIMLPEKIENINYDNIKNPLDLLYNISDALNNLHSKGICLLSIDNETIGKYNDKYVLIKFNKAKIMFDSVTGTSPIVDEKSFPPENNDYYGTFTDVWLLGVYIMNVYDIFEELNFFPYNPYVANKIVTDFFSSDHTNKIIDYYLKKKDFADKAILINSRVLKGEDAETVIKSYYKKNSDIIERLLDKVENLEELTEEIKNIKRSGIKKKAKKISSLINGMTKFNFSERYNLNTVLRKISKIKEYKPIVGKVYDLQIEGDTYYDNEKARTIINEIYQECANEKYSFTVLLFSLSYCFINLDQINDTKKTVKIYTRLSHIFCNNLEYDSDSYYAAISLNYYLYSSEIYTYIKNKQQVIDLLEEIASGRINYYDYKWYKLAEDEKYEKNKSSLSDKVINLF